MVRKREVGQRSCTRAVISTRGLFCTERVTNNTCGSEKIFYAYTANCIVK